MVELAVIAATLVALLLIAGDFGRLFYLSIAVNNAARAGAQYGSQSLVTAADLTGMQNAATTDSSSVTATASECTCATSTNVAACAASYCTDNPQATYVTVNTQATFRTLFHFSFIPTSVTLTGQAIMQVQQ